ncbi:hypothetical protein DSL72_006499 [Monilinia vaccinii-corymbosi]|uniref:2EXR domain-containing protein n=1 Tax=Monilinia vaccinii-corymbosi TaxID=61207 RepID=A0A8A3PNX7_9HELO|nr:hypothetical protein DSL72_006499 [Monilinia vaccinii-corymbosi]
MSPSDQSFTFFSKLPVELRLMIWNHSMSPRVIEVQYNYAQNSCVSKDVPSQLLVSREARAEVLQRYEQSFGTRTKLKSAIYFNYELDTVIFDWKSFRDNYVSNCMRYEECRRIKRIRILDKNLELLINNQMRDFYAFTGLEELSISGCCMQGMESQEDTKFVLFPLRLEGWLLEGGMDSADLTNGRLIPKLFFLCQRLKEVLDAGGQRESLEACLVSRME